MLVVTSPKIGELSSFQMLVDQQRRCFTSRFQLPPGVEAEIARSSTYFLAYFAVNDQQSFNTIPQHGADCTSGGDCVIDCWQAPLAYEPAVVYTFRLSAAFADRPTDLRSLTVAVNASAWDARATRSIALDWLHDSRQQVLTLRWQPPIIAGTIIEYQLDFRLTA